MNTVVKIEHCVAVLHMYIMHIIFGSINCTVGKICECRYQKMATTTYDQHGTHELDQLTVYSEIILETELGFQRTIRS